ncbi:hypothetical protein [Hydrogenophaga sp. 5NK40-0174]|uniref:hypothetical protein n=1 Tax=Hydrogenophaga sp. 5NK40-0174 TaxID=3127649 RepID=UPI00333FCB32
MNSSTQSGQGGHDEEEYLLPSTEALMAGTFALMTGYAQSAESCPNRQLMVRKLISNLFFLANHPDITPQMRTMLSNLRTRWQLVAESGKSDTLARQQTPLWHQAPESVH